MPGVTGTFVAEGNCEEFADPEFAGVCVADMGQSEETATAFAVDPSNLFTSCELVVSACKTFAQGAWVQEGGQCEDSDSSGSPGGAFGGGDDAADGGMLTADGKTVCALSPGIAGGGHMDTTSAWNNQCPNSNSSYSMPLRWKAAHTVRTTQKPTFTRGTVWYDLENGRRRGDSYMEEGELNMFNRARNSTFIHVGDMFYMINWDNNTCFTMPSPVGILRPNWIIDSLGFQATSQYLGKEYVEYEGSWRRVVKFRKTEPLEDAFMIQMYDDEHIWETPEGVKKRPLIRQTPGAPFQGDAIDMYFNHSTDFSDDVFEVYKLLNCTESTFNRSDFEDFDGFGSNDTTEGDGESDDDDGGFGGGLNFNSSLHVDSSVMEVRCFECDITYDDEVPEDDTGATGGDEPAAADADADADAGQDVQPVSGVFDLDQEPYLHVDWTVAGNGTLIMKMTAKTQNWFGLGFPEIECAMVPSESVVIEPTDEGLDVSTYYMTQRSMSGFQDTTLTVNDNTDGFQLLSAEKVDDDGDMIVEIHRTLEKGSTEPVSVTWASGDTRNLGYHGIDNKGCFKIEF